MNADPRDPRIGTEELLERLDDPGIRIADVRWFLGEPERGLLEFQQGHIPGAVFVDLDHDLAATGGPGRHPLPDPIAFADRLGELGFGDHHTIVVHDAAEGQHGARLWWMLDRLGHRDVLMLDGGLAAWRAIDGPWTALRPSPLRSTLTLATEWHGTIDREELVARADDVDLVDVRTPERYVGDEDPIERVAGHIPGARNRPCASMLDSDGRLLAADELQPLIRDDSERAQKPLVISCGSGVTACFGMLAARVAGMPDPLLYPGSFSDWVASDMPVATGSEPGDLLASG